MPTDGPKRPDGDHLVNADTDYYELLQISPNADPDTVTRVFRLLAQRYHPDHPDTGNESMFREILSAYAVLSDPEKRASYDVHHGAIRRDRRPSTRANHDKHGSPPRGGTCRPSGG